MSNDPENPDLFCDKCTQIKSACKCSKPKRIRNRKKNSDGEKLKISFWFIDKMGGIDEANRILRAAGAALKELKE